MKPKLSAQPLSLEKTKTEKFWNTSKLTDGDIDAIEGQRNERVITCRTLPWSRMLEGKKLPNLFS